MLARRDVVGIAGADAHSRLPLTKRRILRLPSYESLFSLARLHLLLERPLTGSLAADRAAVVDAIRQGRLYVGLDALAPADGFAFVIEGVGRPLHDGGARSGAAGAHARAGGRVPKGTRLVLLRDGSAWPRRSSGSTFPSPGPGVYRVEARVPGWPVPWVLTNPVYVFDESAREARAAAAAWPPAPASPEATPLASLPGSSAFTPEFDKTSSVEPATVAAGAAPGGETR